MYHFYPFAKELSPKINKLQAITFDEESASDGQKFIALPKRHFFEKIISEKKIAKKFFWASKNEMSGIV